jgi:Zn-dependent protease with chaperone function
MSILELRTDKERTLFTFSLVVSIGFWAMLVLGTLGLGLFYIAAGAGFVLLTQAMFLAAIKNRGVKITKDQLPELHARIEKAAERLQLDQVPEAYLLNERGLFNAFATRFLGRDFIVLYAELLEACDESDGSIDFIIGHELGHLALGHLKFAPVLLPSKAVPLLGQAYSRACEYSCDRAGTVVAQRPESAVRGLLVLAAGGRYAKRVNVEQYLEQRQESAGFFAGVVELGMSHPFLPKRVGALLADTKPELDVQAVARNPFSYVVAPMLAGGGAGALVIGLVMFAGIGAAIAVPSYMKYQEASARSAMKGYEGLEGLEQLEAAAKEEPSEDSESDSDEPEIKLDGELEKRLAEQIKIEQQRILDEAAKAERDAEIQEAARAAEAAVNEAMRADDEDRPRLVAPKKQQQTVKKVRAPKAPKVKKSKPAQAEEVLY